MSRLEERLTSADVRQQPHPFRDRLGVTLSGFSEISSDFRKVGKIFNSLPYHFTVQRRSFYANELIGFGMLRVRRSSA